MGAAADGEALSGGARTAGWTLVGLLACALILANTAALRSDTDYEELGAYRRLWADLARGVTTYLDREYPVVIRITPTRWRIG